MFLGRCAVTSAFGDGTEPPKGHEKKRKKDICEISAARSEYNLERESLPILNNVSHICCSHV